jgi:hypothetical protein
VEQGKVYVSRAVLRRGRCNRENAKLSRLRKKRWIESLESRGRKLQNTVNLFLTGLRQPADARTALTLGALIGVERLWPSYQAIVAGTPDISTSSRLVSFPRAIPPRDLEAMTQICHDDLELLMAIGASPASFVLVAKNQTLLFLSKSFCTLTGIAPEDLTGRKFGALLVGGFVVVGAARSSFGFCALTDGFFLVISREKQVEMTLIKRLKARFTMEATLVSRSRASTRSEAWCVSLSVTLWQ